VSVQTGRISGVLQRDPTGLYTPLSGDAVGTTNSELDRILYQPAQPWPYADDTQDLQYIANDLGLYGYPDIRSAYYKNTSAPWSILQSQVTNTDYVPCPYPQDQRGKGSTFYNLTHELADEFQWVQQVLNFGTNLLSPYVQYEGYISQDVDNVTNTVNASKPVPPAAKVKVDWLTLAANVMYLGSGIATLTGANTTSAVLGLIGSAGELATQVMATVNQDNGAPVPADAVNTTASELKGQLLDQVQAYEYWVQHTTETDVLRDYGKLKEVGPAVLGAPAWAWGTDTTPVTLKALRGNTRASAYSALIPAVWPGYNLKPDNLYGAGSEPYSNNTSNFARDSNQNSGSNHRYPFANATHANQLWWVNPPAKGQPSPTAQHQTLTTQQPDGGAVDQAWLFAQLNNNATPVYMAAPWNTTLPTPDLTHYIYGADSTNLSYGAYQFAPVWWRNTYNPPSYTQCYRSSGSGINYNSTGYPPPNIPPPQP
jgi:hypothetical protein